MISNAIYASRTFIQLCRARKMLNIKHLSVGKIQMSRWLRAALLWLRHASNSGIRNILMFLLQEGKPATSNLFLLTCGQQQRATAHLFIARQWKSRIGNRMSLKPYSIRPAHDIYIKQGRQGPGSGCREGDSRKSGWGECRSSTKNHEDKWKHLICVWRIITNSTNGRWMPHTARNTEATWDDYFKINTPKNTVHSRPTSKRRPDP